MGATSIEQDEEKLKRLYKKWATHPSEETWEALAEPIQVDVALLLNLFALNQELYQIETLAKYLAVCFKINYLRVKSLSSLEQDFGDWEEILECLEPFAPESED